jgi:hypothetical protein
VLAKGRSVTLRLRGTGRKPLSGPSHYELNGVSIRGNGNL